MHETESLKIPTPPPIIPALVLTVAVFGYLSNLWQLLTLDGFTIEHASRAAGVILFPFGIVLGYV